ncbi:MAG: DUF2059 domain-containing protein [Pseudomonadota bacterium]
MTFLRMGRRSGRAPRRRGVAMIAALGAAGALAVPALAQSFSEPAPLLELRDGIQRDVEAAAEELPAPSGAALVDIAGIDDRLAPLENGVRQQLIDSRAALSVERLDHVAAAYDGAALNAGVAQRLEATVPEGTRRAVAAFYASPLGRKLMGLESEAVAALQEPNTRYTAEILAMSADLDARPEREALLTRIAKAMDARTVNRLMMQATTSAMLRGIALAQGDAVSDDQLDVEVDRELDQVWDLVEEFDRLTQAWMYREAEDAELDAFLTFLEGEEAQAFVSAANAAISERLSAASLEFGDRIAAAKAE